MFYFYIICYYLKQKLQFINNYTRFKRKSLFRNNFNTMSIIYSLHSLYGEIHNFNNTYWSKFLFFIWISLRKIVKIFDPARPVALIFKPGPARTRVLNPVRPVSPVNINKQFLFQNLFRKCIREIYS